MVCNMLKKTTFISPIQPHPPTEMKRALPSSGTRVRWIRLPSPLSFHTRPVSSESVSKIETEAASTHRSFFPEIEATGLRLPEEVKIRNSSGNSTELFSNLFKKTLPKIMEEETLDGKQGKVSTGSLSSSSGVEEVTLLPSAILKEGALEGSVRKAEKTYSSSDKELEKSLERPSLPSNEGIPELRVELKRDEAKSSLIDSISQKAQSLFHALSSPPVKNENILQASEAAIKRLDSFESGSKDAAAIFDLTGNLATLLITVKESLTNPDLLAKADTILQEIDELRNSTAGNSPKREGFQLTGKEQRENPVLSPVTLPRRILIADDLPSVCKFNKRLSEITLKKAGGNPEDSPVQTFLSGRQIQSSYKESCQAHLDTGEAPPPALIFLDNTMPDPETGDSGRDAGLKTVVKIREFERGIKKAHPGFSPATIILITGDDIDHFSEGALKSDGLIVKPATPKHLNEAFLRHQDS